MKLVMTPPDEVKPDDIVLGISFKGTDDGDFVQVFDEHRVVDKAMSPYQDLMTLLTFKDDGIPQGFTYREKSEVLVLQV